MAVTELELDHVAHLCESLTGAGIKLVGELGYSCRCRVDLSIARCSQQQGKHRGKQKPERKERWV